VLFWFVDSYPGLILLLLLFLFFCITAGRSFFLILSLLVWIAAEAIEGKDGSGPVKWCISFYLTISTCALCAKAFKAFTLKPFLSLVPCLKYPLSFDIL